MRLLVAALFVGHGLVHGIMFALPYNAKASADLPFNPSHSWLLGDTRSFAFVFALVVTLAFIIAGGGYLWRASWWPAVTIGAAALSLLLLVLYASRWWTVGYLISSALRSLRGGRRRRGSDRGEQCDGSCVHHAKPDPPWACQGASRGRGVWDGPVRAATCDRVGWGAGGHRPGRRLGRQQRRRAAGGAAGGRGVAGGGWARRRPGRPWAFAAGHAQALRIAAGITAAATVLAAATFRRGRPTTADRPAGLSPPDGCPRPQHH